MANKKASKFLNFIGFGAAEDGIEAEDTYNEEEIPMANNNRRENNYSSPRGYAARDDYGYEDQNGFEGNYDNGYDNGYYQEQQTTTTYGSSKIVNHPSVSARHRTMIYQLNTYEDSKDVIDDLLEGHTVLINLESLDLPEAQRIIDTLIGACYAINATIKKAAQQTYLLAPETVEVAGTYADDGNGSIIGDARH